MNSIRIDSGAVSKNIPVLVLLELDNAGEHPALQVGRLPRWICYKMLLVGSGGRVGLERVGPPLILLVVQIVIYGTLVD
jgi:hypothetical protein